MEREKYEDSAEYKLREEFKDKIKAMTLDDLPDFLCELMNRQHDYGSVCVAIGLGAAATAWAMNNHANGGVTGFQAGAISWEILRHWGALYPGECGGRMLDFDDLLYPQYCDKFTTIEKKTFERVQEAAKQKLSQGDGFHPDVKAHLESIVAGNVPFGLDLVA